MYTVRIPILLQSVILFIAMLTMTSTVPAQTATAPSGNGTSETPYLISSLENLYWVSQNSSSWDKYFTQTVNIDASETSTWNSGQGWTPIGNITVNFTGTYDGNHYTIDGLCISRSGVDAQSFFGYTNGAVVTNIGMINVNITGRQYPAAIAAILNGSTMNNCYSAGTVSGVYFTGGLAGTLYTNGVIINSYSSCSVSSSLDYTGGLVGRIWDGSISKSYFTGSVTGIRDYTGGLTGDCQGNTSIINSYSTGSVTGSGNVGGLAGRITSGTISNCYSTGGVSGTTSVGGLIGTVSSATVVNSFWNTQTSDQSISAGGTGKTTAEMKEYATYYFENGWDFLDETINGSANVWGMNPAENNGYPFLSMQGFTHAPDFEVITFSLSGITSTGAEVTGIAGKTSGTQHGFCWNTSGTPTVADANIELGAVTQTGSYPYTITGLTPATTYYVRAFIVDDGVTYYGEQLSFGTIFWHGAGTSMDPYLIATKTDLRYLSENSTHWTSHFTQTADITFAESDFESGGDFYNDGEGWVPIGNTDASFSGTYDGDGYSIDGLSINRPAVDNQGFFGWSFSSGLIKNLHMTALYINGNSSIGGIAGWNSGEIDNCSTTGEVNGTEMTGGLAGGNSGTIANSNSNCTTTGETCIGGFVGYSETGSFFNNHNAGSVMGLEYAGGLIGSANSTAIDKCSNSGAITGETYVGGLLGFFSSENTVSESYTIGSVSGLASVGGFAGYSEGSYTIINCYTKGDVTRSSGTNTTLAGFVGENYGGTIDRCYSTGTVVYDGGVNPIDNGFAGYDMEGIYSNNFFDVTSSNQTSGVGATPKTTTEMKTNSTFVSAGWSESVWFMESGTNDGYPYLAWQNPDGSPMPVELSSFTAIARGRGAELAWKTATEVNNHGFEVERKPVRDSRLEVGGSNHETQTSNQAWSHVGFVQGSGTTNAPKEYSYTDKVPVSGKYLYRLKQIDNDGKFEYSSAVEVNASTLANGFELAQNHPNPFNPTTTIAFALVKDEFVSLKVYDMLGKEIATLVKGKQSAGAYSVPFEASRLPSGIYFYTLRAGSNVETKKMLLVK